MKSGFCTAAENHANIGDGDHALETLIYENGKT